MAKCGGIAKTVFAGEPALAWVAHASRVLVLASRQNNLLDHIMRCRLLVVLFAFIVRSTTIYAEIRPADCARAAKYSESKRGVSMLVMQNGRTISEHYANGGSARGRWPILSWTKSFWGTTALAGVRAGLCNY